jgi:secreted trypsin-like serine protease
MLRLILPLLLTLAKATTSTPTPYIRRTQESSNYTLSQRIIGGSEAADGEFPWFTVFVPLVQCGGTLIAPDRILTAAHCVQFEAPAAVRVGPTNSYNGEQLRVKCAQRHPDFFIDNLGNVYNDVAVIKLWDKSDAPPISLNSNTAYPSIANTSLTVIGFGVTAEGGSTSSVLKKLGTYFQTISSCQDNYPEIEFGTHVCADVENEGDCQG